MHSAIRTASLSPAETDAILALGHDFAAVWDDPACPMVLKKKIARTLINEIVVDLDEAAQTTADDHSLARRLSYHLDAAQAAIRALSCTRPHWKTLS